MQKQFRRYFKSRRYFLETPIEVEGAATPPEPKPVETIPTPPREDVTALKETLAKVRLESSDSQKSLKSKAAELLALQTKFKDINPDEYQALVRERESLQGLAAEREATAATFANEKSTLLSSHATEIEVYESTVAQLKSQIQDGNRSRMLEKEFFNIQGRPEIADDGLSYFQVFEQFAGRSFVLSEDGKAIVVVDSTGTPMKSVANPKEAMSPSEYLKGLHRHPILGNCFKLESVPNGSGVNAPTGQSKVTATRPVSTIDRLNAAKARDKGAA